MNSKLILLVTSLALPLAVAGQNPATANKPNEQLSSSDKSFVTALIQEDISEIDLAKMALQKSADPQVKDYAQTKILGADPEMRERADQIAQQYGINPPTEPNARQKQVHGELSGKNGNLFDQSYMVYEATQQSADLQLVNAEINSTKNPTIKSYASKEKTPVEQAAASAIDVNKKVSSEMLHYKETDNGAGSGQHQR
jgi:putative membrane protein